MTDTVSEADLFTDPAPARRTIEYDGWGRYKLPDPNTGRERGFTRVTTIAATLEDQYHLNQWSGRKILEGLVTERGPSMLHEARQVIREFGPDPQEKAAKDRLNRIAKNAKDAAGSSAGAESGTALHSITEDYNRGKIHEARVRAGELSLTENLAAYIRALDVEGVTVLPEFMERIVFVPELDAVGRLDNLVRERGAQLMRVFDLKSQKSMDFGAMKIAIQLGIYANAEAMFNEETWAWEEMPPVDKEVATVCWLPVLPGVYEKFAEFFDVDLVYGWRWARAAYQTRQGRKVNPVTRRAARPGPPVVTSGAVHLDRVPAARPEPSGELVRQPRLGVAGEILRLRDEVQAGTKAVAEAGRTSPELGLDWSARFRHCRTQSELTAAGKECKDSGGMTEELKALGKKLHATLPA